MVSDPLSSTDNLEDFFLSIDATGIFSGTMKIQGKFMSMEGL